jgi:hypothetical protein
MLDLSAKIWCRLLVLLSDAVLPWSEPEATERGATRTSTNKVSGGVLDLVGNLRVACRGGRLRRLPTRSGALGKIDEAASRSSYTAARCSRGDQWSAWRPLLTPVQFLRTSVFNLLQWRPTNLDATIQAHLRPSGVVPGAGMGRRGRRFISACGDEEEGPDGFLSVFCRGFFERSWDLVIISFFGKVLYVTCKSTADI